MATAKGAVLKGTHWGTEGSGKVASIAHVAQSCSSRPKVVGEEEWGKISREALQNQACQWVRKRKKVPNRQMLWPKQKLLRK